MRRTVENRVARQREIHPVLKEAGFPMSPLVRCINRNGQPTKSRFQYDRNTGYLYINGLNEYKALTKIGDWNHGLQIFKWEDGWKLTRLDPFLSVLRYGDSDNRKNPISAFMQTIPKHIRVSLNPFIHRHFIMLQLIRLRPEWLEFLFSNPALAWLAADRILKTGGEIDQFAELVFKKRTDILRVFDLPCEEADVRLLSRIRFAEYRSGGFQCLERVLLNQEPRIALRRLKRIQGEHLRFLYIYHNFIGYPFGPAICAQCTIDSDNLLGLDRYFSTYTDRCLDLEYIATELNTDEPVRSARKCRTIDEFTRLHDRWMQRCKVIPEAAQPLPVIPDPVPVQTIVPIEPVGLHYPSPPLAGTDDIVPIRSKSELETEGRRMHHCVGGYLGPILHGTCFIYRVLKPQRATLEITINSQRRFSIGHLKLSCNNEPLKKTRDAVELWMAWAMEERLIRLVTPSSCVG